MIEKRHLFLLDSLSEKETAILLQRSTVQDYGPGTVIFKEGDPGDRCSIILEGEIEIINSYGSEIERVIAVLQPGNFMGEMSLFFKERVRTATARTRTQVKLFEIPVDHFDQLVRQTPGLAYQIMQLLVGRVISNERATINELRESNRLLAQSLKELQEAQEQIIAKEKMETELATARQIQESMLPDEIPELPGWDLAAHWQPARAVSGDFYDFIPLQDGRMALVIGDVTDKGVPAALLMTVTRSVLRTAVRQADSPGELLALVNNILSPQMPMSMFVTLLVVYLDPSTGNLEAANGGHVLPLLYQSEEIHELNVRGMALGLFPDQTYPQISFQLQPGDRMLLYSDGLVEVHSPKGEAFGSEVVKQMLQSNRSLPDRLLIANLLDRLNQFTGPTTEREDDITIISLRKL
jgi:serine phosphatase RsbU (regulator of sigma subunit)